MSVINQVLNELEKRGESAPLDETAIRSVVSRGQSPLLRYALLAGILLILAVSATWYLGREKTAASGSAVAMAVPANDVALVPGPAAETESAPIEAGTTDSNREPGVQQSVDNLYGKPLLKMESEAEPVAVPEVKKKAGRKPQRIAKQVAENTESLPSDNLEQLKTISPQQRAENEFSKANRAVQEGRTNDALAGYRNALLADPTYKPARQAWVGLLVSLQRNNEAEQVLHRGLMHDSHDTWFAMMLARLQVERDATPLALETLQKTLPYAEGQADYQSFVAALLQRQDQHEEAVAHYQIALKLVPNNGVWLMGLGISLQALHRKDEARNTYQHALASNTLSPQLQAYVKRKLSEL